jgi:hypothetical protein
MARKLVIDDPITWVDPLDPSNKEKEEQITKGEAVLRTVRLGVPRYIAAKASGVDAATLRRWEASAKETAELPASRLTANQKRLRSFCADLEKADADSYVYAVAMVRKHMPTHWGAAMTHLERRIPEHFGRRLKVEEEKGERQPDPLDPATVKEVEDAFDAANVPEGIDPASLLPEVGGDG